MEGKRERGTIPLKDCEWDKLLHGLPIWPGLLKPVGKSYAQGARQTERSVGLAWRKLRGAHMYVHTKDTQLNLLQVYEN